MKKLLKIFLLTGLATGFFNLAEAQRGRDNDYRGSVGTSENVTRNAPVRTFAQRDVTRTSPRSADMAQATPRRNVTSPQRDITRTSSPRSANVAQATPQREETRTSQRSWNNVQSTTPREVITRTPERSRDIASTQNSRNYDRVASVSRSYSRNNNDYRYNNSRYNNNNYRYNNNYSNNYYRTRYIQRPVFMYGPRYSVIPRSSISIYFGGNPYYYNDGFFYGYYGGYYQPLFPPFGIRVGFLPFGYTRFFIGVDPFFYYNGIYYRQYDDNTYEVVDAPMGATVSSLPKGAKSVVVNGEKLYELNGTYYKADRDYKGRDIYTVVGKNGEINNSVEDESITAPAILQIGDVVNQLPEGSKIVTINGEKMYVTPDGTYLLEESVNGVVQYKVTGK